MRRRSRMKRTRAPVRAPIPVRMPCVAGVKLDDKFTIAGLKMTYEGWITDCSPGEETVLVASEFV